MHIALARAVGGVLACCALAAPAPAAERPHLDVRLFAKLEAPGSPASLAIAPGGTIYTASYKHAPRSTEPSVVFAYAPDGRLLRRYEVQGQQRQGIEGASVAGVDADGIVYGVNQRPAFSFTLDPASGEQRPYGSFADLAPCSTGASPCSPTLGDLPPSPNFSVFGADGALYTTDFQQAVVWRTPRGGGPATVWLADARLDNGPFGTSGIEWLPDGRLLVGTFASTGALGEPDAAASRLFAVPVAAGGAAGVPEEVWQGQPGDFPDDFAVARSGTVYVALAGGPNALIELGPDFAERARITDSGTEIPFDTPTAVHFDGERLLVANMSLKGDAANWALFDVWAGEPGLPMIVPQIRPVAEKPAAALAPSVKPKPQSKRVKRLACRTRRQMRSAACRRLAKRCRAKSRRACRELRRAQRRRHS